jgi:hypothetical protein
MKKEFKMSHMKFWIVISLLFFVVSCSDGIDGTGVAAIPPQNLYGVVTDENFLGNTTLLIKGSNGKTVTSSTNSEGYYSAVVSDLNTPYIVRVGKNKKDALYTIAFRTGNANVNPLTDLIIRSWYSVKGYSIENEYNSMLPVKIIPNAMEINNIENVLKKILELVLIEFNLNALFDFFNYSRKSEISSFNLLLAQLKISISYKKINITLKNPDIELKNKIIDNLKLNTDFTLVDIIPPGDIIGLLVKPADLTSIKLTWNDSYDNLATSGYYVYRDGSLIVTTPYIYFHDSNLNPGQQYCYKVQAFDSTGLKSPQTAEKCTSTLFDVDVTAPSAVIDLKAIPVGSRAIELSWSSIKGMDVFLYKIFSSAIGIDYTNNESVVASSYIDITPLSSSETCYTVYVVDASGNSSTISNEVCSGTSPDINAPITRSMPIGGNYTTAQFVRLSCNDGQFDSGCEKTYFTLDGSIPNGTSSIYQAPIEINRTITIRYYSKDYAGNSEFSEKVENEQNYVFN